MPEGPEVKTITDILAEILIGKSILGFESDNQITTKGLDELSYPSKIINVYAKGKKTIFELENGDKIVTSYGMEGKWLFKGLKGRSASEGGEKRSHTHVIMHYDDGELYYDNSRRIGGCIIVNDKSLNEMGPDILAQTISKNEWKQRLLKYPGKKIEAALVDQKIFSGIGNYLKSEILYFAGIRPDRTIKSLSDEELERLRVVSHNTIRESYKLGGFSHRSFWSPKEEKGNYVSAVYGKKFDPEGRKVEFVSRKGGGSTYWVPEVQV